MRLLATLLVLLAAIYLHLGGVQADTKDDKNNFYYNNVHEPNIKAYIKLLEEVQLENNGDEVITVIIDTVNVYVVGYLVGSTIRPTLHYLNLDDADQREALLQAFPNIDYTHRLGFAGNYGSLSGRERTEFGHVRTRNIEHLILQSMYGQNLNFILDNRAICPENRWSDLSEQIQWSVAVGVDEQCPYGELTTKIIRRDGQCLRPPLRGTVLEMAEDNNSSRQAWNARDYTQPTINYISGFRKMCLQANGANASVWLANCVIDTEPRQQ
nr:ribosome-inactivating protein [Tanacetum cinerariifolium]